MTRHRSFGSLVGAGVIILLLPALSAGQSASLLRDINIDNDGYNYPVPEGIVYGLHVARDKLYFVANDGVAGYEVWVSDGTSKGTEILRDLCPGSCGTVPELVGGLGGLMFWTAELGTSRRQLLRTDGTRPGTFALADGEINSGLSTFFRDSLYFVRCSGSDAERDCDLWQTDGSVVGTRIFQEAPRSFAWLSVAGDRLYYLVLDSQGFDLWGTDGTAAGTVRLHRFEGLQSNLLHLQASAGGRLFFLANDRDEGSELWTSDGTVAGTRAVTHFSAFYPFLPTPWLKPVGNRIYFTVDGEIPGRREIWRSDGTDTGTVRLTKMPEGHQLSDGTSSFFAEVAGLVVFNVNDSGRLWPWTTRGTPASTAPLARPCESCFLSPDTKLIESGGRVFFLAHKNFLETELWVTDSTAAGSRRVRELCSACISDSTGPLMPWKGGVLFPVGSGHNAQIWFSDGTPAGTGPFVQPDEAVPLTNHFGEPPFEMAEIGGKVYFFAQGESQGLWVRDTDGKTQPVLNLPITGPTSEPRRLTSFGGRLYFSAQDGPFSSGALWSSAGTPETTSPVDMPSVSWEDAAALVPVGGLLFFQLEETFGPHDLWRTDGTPSGTFVVAHLQAKAVMVPFQGLLYYFDGGGIWRTDGTVQGTVKTGELPAGLANMEFARPGPNGMYFKGVTFPTQFEIWFTDGTTAGTRPLTNLDLGSLNGLDPQFTSLGPYTYFSWAGLWKSDGTPAGTARLEGLPADEVSTKLFAYQGSLYFFTVGFDSSHKIRLWRTDGTTAGTVQIGQFPFLPFEQAISSLSSGLIPFAGKLFFNVDDGVHGTELWSTDGTAAGTALVRDLYPGPRSSAPDQLTVAGGRLFFVAGDDVHGIELWQSDGTAAGTRLVQDVGPQAASSNPEQLTVAGDKLFFTADDGITGREVWVLPLSGPSSCHPSSTRLCLNGGRYAVEAAWRDFQDHRGVGHAAPLTADTGYFWFFSPTNVEAVLKVLDGRALNDHVWVFYGALSTVEYSLTVTDTETGLTHRYVNPSGQLASVGDTAAFGPLGATTAAVVTSVAPSSSSLTLMKRRLATSAATGSCSPSSTRLCLNGSRFAVEIAWKDFEGHTGNGQAVELTSDTGWFWFFSPTNVEVMLKVLDGTPVNGHHWVFYGALSSVEYTVTVTDTQTGEISTYRNPSGQFASVADTGAF